MDKKILTIAISSIMFSIASAPSYSDITYNNANQGTSYETISDISLNQEIAHIDSNNSTTHHELIIKNIVETYGSAFDVVSVDSGATLGRLEITETGKLVASDDVRYALYNLGNTTIINNGEIVGNILNEMGDLTYRSISGELNGDIISSNANSLTVHLIPSSYDSSNPALINGDIVSNNTVSNNIAIVNGRLNGLLKINNAGDISLTMINTEYDSLVESIELNSNGPVSIGIGNSNINSDIESTTNQNIDFSLQGSGDAENKSRYNGNVTLDGNAVSSQIYSSQIFNGNLDIIANNNIDFSLYENSEAHGTKRMNTNMGHIRYHVFNNSESTGDISLNGESVDYNVYDNSSEIGDITISSNDYINYEVYNNSYVEGERELTSTNGIDLSIYNDSYSLGDITLTSLNDYVSYKLYTNSTNNGYVDITSKTGVLYEIQDNAVKIGTSYLRSEGGITASLLGNSASGKSSLHDGSLILRQENSNGSDVKASLINGVKLTGDLSVTSEGNSIIEIIGSQIDGQVRAYANSDTYMPTTTFSILDNSSLNDMVDITSTSDINLTFDNSKATAGFYSLSHRGNTYATLNGSELNQGFGLLGNDGSIEAEFIDSVFNGDAYLVSNYRANPSDSSIDLLVDNTVFNGDLRLDADNQTIDIKKMVINGQMLLVGEDITVNFLSDINGSLSTIDSISSDSDVNFTIAKDALVNIKKNAGNISSSSTFNNNGTFIFDNSTVMMARVINSNGSKLSIGNNHLQMGNDIEFQEGSILSLVLSKEQQGSLSLLEGNTSSITFDNGSSIEVEVLGVMPNNKEYLLVNANDGSLNVDISQLDIDIKSLSQDASGFSVYRDGNSIVLLTPDVFIPSPTPVTTPEPEKSPEIVVGKMETMSQNHIAKASKIVMEKGNDVSKDKMLEQMKSHGLESGNWVEIHGSKGENNALDYDIESEGVLTGASRYNEDRKASIGVMIGINKATIENRNYENDIESIQLGLYGAVEVDNNTYMNWSTAIAYNEYEQSRENLDNATPEYYSSAYNGEQLFSDVSIIKEFKSTEKLVLSPYAGTSYTFTHIDDFNEKGIGDNALSYDSFNNHSVDVYSGVKAQYTYTLDKLVASPYIDVSYKNEVINSGDTRAHHNTKEVAYIEDSFDTSITAELGLEVKKDNLSGKVKIEKEKFDNGDNLSGGLEINYMF